MKAIITRQDAVNFIHGCIIWIGPSFHPNTLMSHYADANGHMVFPFAECRTNQDKLDKCHKILGDEIYEIGLEFSRKMGYAPTPDGGGEKQHTIPLHEKQPHEFDWNSVMNDHGTYASKAMDYVEKAVTEPMAIKFFQRKQVVDNLFPLGNGLVQVRTGKKVVCCHDQLNHEDAIWLAREVQKAIAERAKP